MRASIWLAMPLAVALCAAPAQAQQTSKVSQTVKIGVLSDMSGLYADIGGPGSVVAARMAVDDFKPESHGIKVEIVSADHQNKPDIGAAIARRWFDVDHVNAVADVPNSGVALAVSNVAREKNGVFLVSGAADSDLTDKQCSPNTVHWTYDTWALAHGTGGAIVRQGGKTWFFITAD
jgi:branched-chain amino acid transport system substrate-binding protein